MDVYSKASEMKGRSVFRVQEWHRECGFKRRRGVAHAQEIGIDMTKAIDVCLAIIDQFL